MTEPMFANASKNLCIVCDMPITITGRMTCSEKCHEEFIEFGEKKFGKVKKVVDQTTGIAYEVPTRVIIESGLTWKDLTKYPIWKDEDDQNIYDKKKGE